MRVNNLLFVSNIERTFESRKSASLRFKLMLKNTLIYKLYETNRWRDSMQGFEEKYIDFVEENAGNL